MKKNFLRAAFVAALMSATAIAAAHAEDKVGKAVGAPLVEAQKAMAAKDWATALADIKQAQAVPNPNPYEVYTINKFLSVVAINTKDYSTATTASVAAADSPALPDEDKKDMYHNALLLTVQAQQYDKAVKYVPALDQMNALDDAMAAAAAVAYYNTKDMANAQKYAQKSLDLSKAAGKSPQPNAQIILGNIEGKTNPDAARKSVEAIVLNTNNPEDWGRLIDDALSHKANSIDALYLYRLRNQVGAMQKGDDYVIWGELATQQKLDKEALSAYDKGIAAGKLTSGQLGKGYATARNAAAQDAGVLSVAASAASKSKRGEDALRVGEDYWGYGRYADAEAMARSALAKGVKDSGEANMLLGTSLAAQGKTDEAQATLAKVGGNEVRARAAHLWSLYAQVKAKGTPAPK
ncbi:MAG: tetratricopeptide repeat protein [Proteobacteria bacterium]|nr:tetratricopeptide repeat protein [Pseudomonadota bacterium]